METNQNSPDFELLGKYLSQELAPEERALFNQWLNNTIANRAELEKIQRYVSYMDANLKMNEVDIEKGRIMTDYKIWKSTAQEQPKNIRLHTYDWVKSFYRAAAIILLLVCIAGVSLYFLPLNSKGKTFTEIIAPIGSRTHLQLADGTSVWLNAGSTLRYSNDFSKTNRSVQLEGEAYFDVTHDKLHPFYVKTPTINLKVLGTTFNIKAYNDENIVEATLITGKIVVEKTKPSSGEKNIELQPNQKAVFLKSENKLYVDDLTISHPSQKAVASKEKTTTRELKNLAQEKPADVALEVEKATAWKDGMLVFDKEPLSNIMIVLGRRFNVHFTCDNNEILNYRFTGKFKETTLEQVIEAIMLTSPLEVTIKQDQVTIHENAAKKKKYLEN